MVTRRLRVILDAYGWEGARRDVVESMLWWQDRCWRGIRDGANTGIPGDQLLEEEGVVAGIRSQYDWTKRHLLAASPAVAACRSDGPLAAPRGPH